MSDEKQGEKYAGVMNPTADARQLRLQRYRLTLDTIDHARMCLKDLRGDLVQRALDMLQSQIEILKKGEAEVP